MTETDTPAAADAAQAAAPRLEDLAPGARVRGVLPDRAVTVVQVEWHGTQAMTLTYREDTGKVDHELLYRANEARLEIEVTGRPWMVIAILNAAAFFDGRLPEAFGGYRREATKYPVQCPTACSPQAWSTGAPLLFLRTMLGLEPIGDHLVVDPGLPSGIDLLALLEIPGRWGGIDAFAGGKSSSADRRNCNRSSGRPSGLYAQAVATRRAVARSGFRRAPRAGAHARGRPSRCW
jgi:hypothetical protein